MPNMQIPELPQLTDEDIKRIIAANQGNIPLPPDANQNVAPPTSGADVNVPHIDASVVNAGMNKPSSSGLLDKIATGLSVVPKTVNATTGVASKLADALLGVNTSSPDYATAQNPNLFSRIVGGVKNSLSQSEMAPAWDIVSKVVGQGSVYPNSGEGNNAVHNTPDYNNGAGKQVLPQTTEDAIKYLENQGVSPDSSMSTTKMVTGGLMPVLLDRYKNSEADLARDENMLQNYQRIPHPSKYIQEEITRLGGHIEQARKDQKSMLENNKAYSEQSSYIDGHVDPSSDGGKNLISSELANKTLYSIASQSDNAIKRGDAQQLSALASVAADSVKNIAGVKPNAAQTATLDAVMQDAKGFFGLGHGQTLNAQNVSTYFATLKALQDGAQQNYNAYADTFHISPQERKRAQTGNAGTNQNENVVAPKIDATHVKGVDNDGKPLVIGKIGNEWKAVDANDNPLASDGTPLMFVKDLGLTADGKTPFSGELMPFSYAQPDYKYIESGDHVGSVERDKIGNPVFDPKTTMVVKGFQPTAGTFHNIINKYTNAGDVGNAPEAMVAKNAGVNEAAATQQANLLGQTLKGIGKAGAVLPVVGPIFDAAANFKSTPQSVAGENYDANGNIVKNALGLIQANKSPNAPSYDAITKEAIKQAKLGDAGAKKYLSKKGIKY